MRMTENNYGSPFNFIAAVWRVVDGAAQEAAAMPSIVDREGGGVTSAAVGVWLDDNRQGVVIRVLRPYEIAYSQGHGWRPHAAFAPSKVDDAKSWVAQKIRGF